MKALELALFLTDGKTDRVSTTVIGCINQRRRGTYKVRLLLDAELFLEREDTVAMVRTTGLHWRHWFAPQSFVGKTQTHLVGGTLAHAIAVIFRLGEPFRPLAIGWPSRGFELGGCEALSSTLFGLTGTRSATP